jgi:hypothetical protein
LKNRAALELPPGPVAPLKKAAEQEKMGEMMQSTPRPARAHPRR